MTKSPFLRGTTPLSASAPRSPKASPELALRIR